MGRRRSSSRTVAGAVEPIVGPDLPIAVETYDGGRIGPADAPATLVVRSADAIRRILTAPGEVGLGRAYVAGDLDVEGDIYAALASLRERLPQVGGPRCTRSSRSVRTRAEAACPSVRRSEGGGRVLCRSVYSLVAVRRGEGAHDRSQQSPATTCDLTGSRSP